MELGATACWIDCMAQLRGVVVSDARRAAAAQPLQAALDRGARGRPELRPKAMAEHVLRLPVKRLNKVEEDDPEEAASRWRRTCTRQRATCSVFCKLDPDDVVRRSRRIGAVG